MAEKGIATLADVLEYEKVPLDQRLKAFNTYDLIKYGASLDPEAWALTFLLSGEHYAEPMQINYRDLLANINRAANLFHDLGVGPTDVVSYLLPGIPQTHYIFWGAEAAGIINPINPLLEPAMLRDILQAAGTKVLVSLGEWPGSDIWEKVMSIRDDLPKVEKIVRVMGPSDDAAGIIGFDEVINNYRADKLDFNRQIEPDDIASILHTGGTTGTPKLAPRSHMNEVSMAFMVGTHDIFHQGDTVLGGLPLFHNYGLMGTGLYPFSIGAHVVMLSPLGFRDPTIIQNFWKIIEHYKAVFFAAVPTVIAMLLEAPKENADISSLRFAICGAAPLSVELARRFEEYVGVKVVEGYGLTEGTTGSSLNPPNGEIKIGSVGLRWPYQGFKIFITNADGKFVREAETDEIGAVCIEGPNVFKGYLEERHNEGIWPKEGWLSTGDMGRQDADGYFWITGRKKELIIRGGHNIDPAIIEEPLYQIPQVQVAAAVGRPDPRVGEMPVAYVQLQEGSKLTEDKILEHLQQSIGERAAVPKQVFIIDEMPLTTVGKIFKPALKWETIKQVYQGELEALTDMADTIEVQVGEDKIHGSLATITIKVAPGVSAVDVRKKADELLGAYTVKYELEITA
jgi:fatty-acyl-CoA synthase